MKGVLNEEQQMAVRLQALSMAVRNHEGQPARVQVDAAATYFNFVADGANPVQQEREQLAAEIKREAEADRGVPHPGNDQLDEDEEPLVPFTVDSQGKVDCADPDVTGAGDIEEALLSKYVDILGPVLHDRLTHYIGGHGVMDLLHVGPHGIGEGPFNAEEKNKILKVLLQVQNDFEDVNLGITEGDSFCDNCNNIHPALDFSDPVSMVRTLREALGKGRPGGLPTFEDFIASLGGLGDGIETESGTLSRMKAALQEKIGEGFEVATHVIRLNPGETPEQGIARHLKENPIPGMELGPNGELPPGVIKLDDSQTRH